MTGSGGVGFVMDLGTLGVIALIVAVLAVGAWILFSK